MNTDSLGRIVPQELVKAFSDTSCFRSKIQAIDELMKELTKMKREVDGGAFLSLNRFRNAVNDLKAELDDSKPHIVCPACSGTKREAGIEAAPECRLCRANGRPQGWLPVKKWDGLTDELKALAEETQPCND